METFDVKEYYTLAMLAGETRKNSWSGSTKVYSDFIDTNPVYIHITKGMREGSCGRVVELEKTREGRYSLGYIFDESIEPDPKSNVYRYIGQKDMRKATDTNSVLTYERPEKFKYINRSKTRLRRYRHWNFLGDEIKVGDWVIFSPLEMEFSRLVIGEVTKMSRVRVTVETGNHTFTGHSDQMIHVDKDKVGPALMEKSLRDGEINWWDSKTVSGKIEMVMDD
jgi:hypothetical protein